MSAADNDAGDNDSGEGQSFEISFAPGPGMVPYFGYRDAAAAIAFLTEVLGFEILSRYDGPDGRVMHAELNFGDGIIMLGSLPAGEEVDAAGDPRPAAMGVYVVVDDVEAHHAAAVSQGLDEKGGRIVYGPQDTEFGTRRYRLVDPEGFEWSFGTYQPTLTGGA